jgi:hypothetical protein
MGKPNIFTMDIETAPNVAHVWGIWQQNVGLNQILEEDSILSFAYKRLGVDATYYMDVSECKEKTMIRQIVKVLDKADIIIGHNFKKFDNKWILRQCLKYNLKPPSNYKIIDTLLVSRQLMRLPSHRLDAVAKFLKCDNQKDTHKKFPGHSLWLGCLAGNKAAWKEMEFYNRQDVIVNEDVYLKLRPYITNHPNVGVYGDADEPVCPKCGHKHVHYRGYFHTNAGRYRKFQCQSCGGWGRLRQGVQTKEKRKALATNA